jgi:ribosome-interacting GTPase 1
MVTNAPPEFYKAKELFEEAKTPEEKLRALYEMLRTAPKHKGAHNLLIWITKQIAKYRELIEKQKRKGGKKRPLIQKSGDLLISILGIENSGKSYLLKKITGVDVKVSEVPFTTVKPQVGTINYKGVLYQFVEVPATFETEFRQIIAISDYYILLLIPGDLESQLNRINEFSAGIIAFSLEETDKYSVVLNNYDDFSGLDVNELLEDIVKKLKLIRTYPINSKRAVLLKEGATIKDFIKEVNERWLDTFRFAKIQRKAKVVKAGLNYELQDGDIVEIRA